MRTAQYWVASCAAAELRLSTSSVRFRSGVRALALLATELLSAVVLWNVFPTPVMPLDTFSLTLPDAYTVAGTSP